VRRENLGVLAKELNKDKLVLKYCVDFEILWIYLISGLYIYLISELMLMF